MQLSHLEWIITLAVMVLILILDVAVVARRPHEPTMRRAALWLVFYVALAMAFGCWVWYLHGRGFALQFYAGWLTEYSLSVDNLMVFLVIMASFGVPKIYQQQALLVGIVLALVFRGVFITLGAVAIHEFTWVFYVLGAFLLWTAANLARGAGHDVRAENVGENAVVRFARRYLNSTDTWDGLKLFVRDGSKWMTTPMFLVIVALGTADAVFAVDSIPAIYGLTQEPYLVFAANAFALMGLRQLYFLLGGLLDRLVYLSRGLAVILLFIGLKLIWHGLRENELPFVNGGERFALPEIPAWLGFAFIVVTLVVTATASFCRTREKTPEPGVG